MITEDAWSYSDESLVQHFYMSVFRAIENRRDLVHNGNSGVTGHISSSGKLYQRFLLETRLYDSECFFKR